MGALEPLSETEIPPPDDSTQVMSYAPPDASSSHVIPSSMEPSSGQKMVVTREDTDKTTKEPLPRTKEVEKDHMMKEEEGTQPSVTNDSLVLDRQVVGA